jgi:subtilisin family serine protease
MRTALRVTLVIALASITSGVGAAAGSTRPRSRARVDLAVAELLSRAPRGEQARVIVRVREDAQERLRNALRAHGDRIAAEHASLRAFSIALHTEDLAALVEDSGVLSISADARVRSSGLLGSLAGGLVNTVGGLLGVVGQVLNPDLSPSPATPLRPKALRDTLGVDGTWTGDGVGIAVIDSGVEASTEFGSRLTASYDFTSGPSPVPMTGRDDYGHGTHVAGTIAQSGRRSSSTSAWRGVASDARIVSLKVLDANGAGMTSDVIEALDFVVDNRAALGIDIINLSLGHPILEPAAVDPLVQAVERAARAGIIVVAAAGNFGRNPETGLPGYAGIISPGNAPSAITVGATETQATVARSDDRVAWYSSRGPTWYDAQFKPDLVAPGHGIVAAAARTSTLYQNYPQIRDASDADYMSLSGTSMATAVASGVIALMVEANRATGGPGAPDLTPNAVKAVLHYTATAVRDDLGVEYDPLTRARVLSAETVLSDTPARSTREAPRVPPGWCRRWPR